MCKDDILDGQAALVEHIYNDHVEHGAQTGESTPEKPTYVFTASEGWVKKFVERHFTSRKDKPCAKPRPGAKPRPNPVPHCATCTCSASVTDDDSTNTEADNSGTESNITYFRPRRAGAAPNYTDPKLSPDDISSESEGSTFDLSTTYISGITISRPSGLSPSSSVNTSFDDVSVMNVSLSEDPDVTASPSAAASTSAASATRNQEGISIIYDEDEAMITWFTSPRSSPRIN